MAQHLYTKNVRNSCSAKMQHINVNMHNLRYIQDVSTTHVAQVNGSFLLKLFTRSALLIA